MTVDDKSKPEKAPAQSQPKPERAVRPTKKPTLGFGLEDASGGGLRPSKNQK
ncbi:MULTISPECIES: hypothetical protein [Gammaproteobacteria]|uniref:Uncharacterized protein n=2 Tax=Acinetobacter calcoaceticus/baumannii complex TaxID=909768 RepID=A0A221SCA0_ACIBA|nr:MULTISPECIES: hypothetical protein [Gammaproteobacteria]ASN73633.1 hypothetical protein [Acinetobacter baumannii]EKU9952609.1 hypothetical protein [Acinetobacter baumannii]EKX3723609.1 hypothetical protein [Acinetobacter baumannii]EKX3754437.1 hypothetical protein [Acinetobacter baumannii]ELB1534488.1 hypothetical protein [Acinetobacter baumannii]